MNEIEVMQLLVEVYGRPVFQQQEDLERIRNEYAYSNVTFSHMLLNAALTLLKCWERPLRGQMHEEQRDVSLYRSFLRSKGNVSEQELEELTKNMHPVTRAFESGTADMGLILSAIFKNGSTQVLMKRDILGINLMAKSFGETTQKSMLLKNLNSTFSTAKKKISDPLMAFDWLGSTEQMGQLYEGLIDANYIAPSTVKLDFSKIFSGKELPATRVRWIGAKNHLPYLIQLLMSNGFLDRIVNANYWKITSSCFSNSSNLKQSVEGYENNKNGFPKGSLKLLRLVEMIKN